MHPRLSTCEIWCSQRAASLWYFEYHNQNISHILAGWSNNSLEIALAFELTFGLIWKIKSPKRESKRQTLSPIVSSFLVKNFKVRTSYCFVYYIVNCLICLLCLPCFSKLFARQFKLFEPVWRPISLVAMFCFNVRIVSECKVIHLEYLLTSSSWQLFMMSQNSSFTSNNYTWFSRWVIQFMYPFDIHIKPIWLTATIGLCCLSNKSQPISIGKDNIG